jgi:hypothetical protein
MGKKDKSNTLNADEALEMSVMNSAHHNTKRVAIFNKRFVLCKSLGPHITNNHMKVFSPGTYTLDQKLIDDLIAENAPIEVFERAID